MKKLIVTLCLCITALSLNAQLININWEKEINKIVEAVLKNPKVDNAIKSVEAQYNAIINDYNRLNNELNKAIEQTKSIEQKFKNTVALISVLVPLLFIIIPFGVGFLLYRRIKKSRIFRAAESLSQLKQEIVKLNQHVEVLSAKRQ